MWVRGKMLHTMLCNRKNIKRKGSIVTKMQLLQLTLGGVTIDSYMVSRVTHKIMENVIFQKNNLTKLLKIIIKNYQKSDLLW